MSKDVDWSWDDGSVLTWTNWQSSPDSGSCAVMQSGGAHTWESEPCSNTRALTLCQRHESMLYLSKFSYTKPTKIDTVTTHGGLK